MSRTLVATSRDVEIPLSYEQERMWFLHQLDERGAEYHLPEARRIRGPLDIAALQWAITQLVRRQEGLRCTYGQHRGVPFQRIRSYDDWPLPVIDLTAVDASTREAELVRVRRAQTERSFDLATEPPLRTCVVRMSADDHVLLATLHHIAGDGWSLRLFWQELWELFEARVRGTEPRLAPLPLQYADYAAWQRGPQGTEAIADHLVYWTQRLRDAPGETALPLHDRRTATERADVVTIKLDAQLVERLGKVGFGENATVFTTLIAGFRALLFRYTGQRDLSIATLHANRNRRDLRAVMGAFSNPLVLRGRVEPETSFLELVRLEQEGTAAAYARHDVPIELVLRELDLKRHRGRNPLFQVLFGQWARITDYESRSGTLELGLLPPQDVSLTTQQYLELYSTEHPDGSHEITCFYQADLFDRDWVELLLQHYRRLLDAAVADPTCAVRELPLLGDGERQRVLSQWARGPEPARDEQPVLLHELFEVQADRDPSAIAVCARDRKLTYGELEARANAIAHRLRCDGVGPGTVVGLQVDRSPEMIVGMLGILKAGAAYLPIDPQLPAERIRHLVVDARAAMVLTREALTHEPAPGAARTRPARACNPEDLAYVLYTSGSTGNPKGVAVTHRSISAYATTAIADYHVSAADRVLQFAAFSWDTSCEEIFPTLAAGATLVLRDPSMLDSTAAFFRTCERDRLTILNLPTAFWHELVASEDADEVARGLATVRLVVIGGEQAHVEGVQRWCERLGDRIRLVNTYGMTEATAVSAMCDLGPMVARDALGGRVPIGRPIAGVETYVLDADLEPTPIGVVGELYVGGRGLARGYLHRPDLTAARFVPHPFGKAGERIYRTGDRARLGRDGILEVLGREDHQVKVRGFRIELGEVEAALASAPAVAHAAVIACDDARGDLELVAYVAPASPGIDVTALRAHLRGRLPEYMIPAAFVELAALPMTTSGKLDRRALPAHAPTRTTAPVEPSTPTQIAVAKIFSEILQVPAGASDDFFVLGGHSLSLLRLLARIAAELGVELTLAAVFDRPTVAALAEQIDRVARTDAPSRDESAERALAARVAALSPAEVTTQLAEWSSVALDVTPTSDEGRELLDRWMAMHGIDANPVRPLARLSSPTHRVIVGQRLHWDLQERGTAGGLTVQSLAAELRGPLNVRAMLDACGAVVARHDALRTVLSMVGGRLTQTVRSDRYEVELVDLSSLVADERLPQAQRLFEALNRSFELERSAFHVKLVRIDEHHHLLVGAMHHIMADGASVMPLVGDVAALYRSHVADRGVELPPLAFTFNDFCFWQNTLEERPVGRTQLEFWERSVAGFEGRPVLGDRRNVERGAVGLAPDTHETGAVPFACQGPGWQALTQMCGRVKCTPYTAFATAFSLVLGRWAETSDILLMSTLFHRNRPGSEAVIGNFAMPYPLRVRFDQDATLEEAIAACHRAVLAQRENAHVAPTTALPMWAEWSRYNINYQIAPQAVAPPDFGGLNFKPLAWTPFAPRGPNDLGLFLMQMPSGVFGRLAYNQERFSHELAAQISACVANVLDLLASAPHTRISELPRGSCGRE